MSDIFQPLPFQGNGPDAPPAAAEEPPKQRRRRGPAKKAKTSRRGRPRNPVAASPESAPTPKAPRPRKARALKVDLAVAMGALTGLSGEDAKFLAGVVQAMQPFSKKSRQRIATALNQLV